MRSQQTTAGVGDTMSSRRARAVVSLVAITSVSACGGGDETDSGESSLESTLDQIPDRAANRSQVIYSNLSAIRREVGAEPTTDIEADIEQLNKAGIQSYFVAEPFTTRLLMIERAEFGFHVPEIDASIQSGLPPDDVSLFAGRFDAEEIDKALTTFEPWAEELERGEDGDLITYAFGEEGRRSMDLVTPGRPIGQNLRIGYAD